MLTRKSAQSQAKFEYLKRASFTHRVIKTILTKVGWPKRYFINKMSFWPTLFDQNCPHDKIDETPVDSFRLF